MSAKMLESFKGEFAKYRVIVERSLKQVTEGALNHVTTADGNSMAMLVRHLSGNLQSRFTDFLTKDGEKPWRNREREFEERHYSRSEVDAMLDEGWRILEETLENLTDADLDRTATIRGQPLSVHAALARSLAHVSYHVGQIVLLARIARDEQWEWITIPKGQSEEYNQNPTMEKGYQQS